MLTLCGSPTSAWMVCELSQQQPGSIALHMPQLHHVVVEDKKKSYFTDITFQKLGWKCAFHCLGVLGYEEEKKKACSCF